VGQYQFASMVSRQSLALAPKAFSQSNRHFTAVDAVPNLRNEIQQNRYPSLLNDTTRWTKLGGKAAPSCWEEGNLSFESFNSLFSVLRGAPRGTRRRSADD
jgi:hypothetical protein